MFNVILMLTGYTCTCPPGREGNGFFYCDEDECVTGNDDCDDKAYCVNTFGAYKCFCEHGYTGDGFNCTKCEQGFIIGGYRGIGAPTIPIIKMISIQYDKNH